MRTENFREEQRWAEKEGEGERELVNDMGREREDGDRGEGVESN